MTEEIKDQEKEEQVKPVEAAADTEPVHNANTTEVESTEKAPAPYRREHRGHQRQPRGGGEKDETGQKFPKFKRKVCKFCYDSKLEINYKKSDILERFITDRGKILPRRVTGTCAKHQRQIAVEIKKARIIALLPFVEK